MPQRAAFRGKATFPGSKHGRAKGAVRPGALRRKAGGRPVEKNFPAQGRGV